MGVVKLISQISSNIIPEIQVERVDFGQYIATGVPEDYTAFVREYLPITASMSEIQRVASLVRQDIEDYLNHIFSIGAKPLRYGQSMQEIFTKSIALPISGSADDLTSDVADALGISINSSGPEGQVISAVYEYKISGDITKLQDSLKSLATTYPELVTIIDTLDMGAKIPAMSGETYETGPGMPNVPAMSGVNYETGAGGLSIPTASKVVPLKKIGQDEYEGEETEEEVPEFGEGPVKLPPERDPEEYIEQQVDIETEEEIAAEREEEFEASLEDEGIDPESLSKEERDQRYKDFLEEREEETEEPSIDTKMERVKNLFDSLANDVGKQEKKPEKAVPGKDMQDRWFNIFGHLPIREYNALSEIMGDKRTDQLAEDIVDLGKVESADFADFAKATQKATSKTKGHIPTRLEYERRKLDNKYMEDLANVYKDYIKDMSLSIAGIHGLDTAKTFIKQWARDWYPDIIEPMQQIERQTSLYNPEFLLPDVEDWKQRIDEYRTAEAEVPDSLLAKIPPTIVIDTDLGAVTVPNPLYEQDPYSRYFTKKLDIPTGPPSRKAHPGTAEYWEKRLQPPPATGVEPARRVYEAPPLPYEEPEEEKNPYETWLESIREPVEKNIADFKQYLTDHNLDPSSITEKERDQALKDFKESRKPILTLDQIDQTLTYLADDIDMELKEAVSKPEREYYSSLTRFVTDTRKDIQNIQTQLTSGYDYNEPDKTSSLLEKAKGVSDTLDIIDADIKEYQGIAKGKETAEMEAEKLSVYEDEYRTLYTSRKNLQEDIEKLNSYIRGHKDELQEAVNTYNGYKAELKPFVENFNQYLRDKGLDPELITDAGRERQRLEYEKILRPGEEGEKQLFHDLTVAVRNLEKGPLSPLFDVRRAKRSMKNTQQRFDEITDYLEEHNIDLSTLAKGPQEIPEKKERELHKVDWETKEVKPTLDIGERYFSTTFKKPFTVLNINPDETESRRYLVELDSGEKRYVGENLENIKRLKKSSTVIPLKRKVNIGIIPFTI